MTYLNCPRCGLSVAQRSGQAGAATCPRCRGRSGVAVPMYATDRPRPPASASPARRSVRRAA